MLQQEFTVISEVSGQWLCDFVSWSVGIFLGTGAELGCTHPRGCEIAQGLGDHFQIEHRLVAAVSAGPLIDLAGLAGYR